LVRLNSKLVISVNCVYVHPNSVCVYDVYVSVCVVCEFFNCVGD